MGNNWARSKSGSSTVVKHPKTRAQSHTIIGAIHSSNVVNVVIRKPPPRKKNRLLKKKRKANNGKKRTANEISTEDPEVDDDAADNKSVQKGTATGHFVKFMNEFLNVMDLDETLKGSYIVMDRFWQYINFIDIDKRNKTFISRCSNAGKIFYLLFLSVSSTTIKLFQIFHTIQQLVSIKQLDMILIKKQVNHNFLYVAMFSTKVLLIYIFEYILSLLTEVGSLYH